MVVQCSMDSDPSSKPVSSGPAPGHRARTRCASCKEAHGGGALATARGAFSEEGAPYRGELEGRMLPKHPSANRVASWTKQEQSTCSDSHQATTWTRSHPSKRTDILPMRLHPSNPCVLGKKKHRAPSWSLCVRVRTTTSKSQGTSAGPAPLRPGSSTRVCRITCPVERRFASILCACKRI